MLILAVLTGLISLVVALPLRTALTAHTSAASIIWIERAESGFIGLVLSYVCWRMWQVVRGDQDLTILQSKFVVRAVERKQAKRFEDQQSTRDVPSFKSPEGYGKLVN